MSNQDLPVLIAGAGPTGLALACDLARRRVPFRIIDKAERYFIGSKGKGLQPRSLEVMDDLGIVDEILRLGRFHLPFRGYDGAKVLGKETSMRDETRLRARRMRVRCRQLRGEFNRSPISLQQRPQRLLHTPLRKCSPARARPRGLALVAQPSPTYMRSSFHVSPSKGTSENLRTKLRPPSAATR
jgi:hypothetical protein